VLNASAAPFPDAAKLPNVRLVEWVDQNALLGHPGLGMFLTHGGHNSVSEAAFHGVPILAVAIFADQWESAARATFHGFGESIDKRTLTADVIKVCGYALDIALTLSIVFCST
jgi:UDP:flavonoid glycosyltransferase YjiC (YdhE family)